MVVKFGHFGKKIIDIDFITSIMLHYITLGLVPPS
jgi:hypothetical protein